jgi:hypothetical protein
LFSAQPNPPLEPMIQYGILPIHFLMTAQRPLVREKDPLPYDFDIFISYGHEDADTAACLAARLDDEGFRCFLAEKDIRPVEQWESRIRDALIASERILLTYQAQFEEQQLG